MPLMRYSANTYAKIDMPSIPVIRNILILLLVFSAAALSQEPDGSSIFQHQCAACHRDGRRTRAPSQEALSQLSRDSILRILETGKMKSVGAKLTRQERVAVAEFLSASEPAGPPPQGGYCRIARRPVFDDPGWNGWGVDTANSRFEPGDVSGLRLR
jgi:polyvinyl alcohol dehydrogenase (cytochrome)